MFETFRRIRGSMLFGSAGSLALGTVLLLIPDLFLQVACYVLGALLIASGVLSVLGSLRADGVRFGGLRLGAVLACAVLVGAGIFVISQPRAISSILPIVVGLLLLFDGVLHPQSTPILHAHVLEDDIMDLRVDETRQDDRIPRVGVRDAQALDQDVVGAGKSAVTDSIAIGGEVGLVQRLVIVCDITAILPLEGVVLTIFEYVVRLVVEDRLILVHDLDGVLTEFDRVIGLSRLKAVHLNDSKNPLGAKKDRHAVIGGGYLGLPALAAVVRHPALQGLPMVLETPNELPGYAAEIALLRKEAAR